MNQGKFNRLWQTDRNPELPLDIYFTGLAVKLLRASQNLHSMIVVQPDRNRQELGYMTYVSKPDSICAKSWHSDDDESEED